MPRKVQAACFVVDFEDGDIVASLVAAIKKIAGGIEIETARIVPSRPFFAEIGQFAVSSDRKNPDAVMKPIARIKKLTVGRNQDF